MKRDKAFSSEVETGSREENASGQESGAPFRFNRSGNGSLRPASVIVIAAIVAGVVIAGLLPGYWTYLATSVLISAVALQSIGLVSGRTGMIALCQMSFAGVGAWTVGYLNVGGAPGNLPIWIVIGGLAAVPFGVAIGLPALRLRGINLAIVTLGFATAFDAILASITFPGQTRFIAVPRPDIFDSDGGYFIFVLIFYVILAVGLEFLIRTRLGAIWLAVRHSERAAAAHGISIPRAKLSAFAISAFIAGVSGGLLAGYLGTLVADNFNMMQSLALFAVSTMTGAQFAEGALIGGILAVAFPEILRRLNLGQDIGNVLFAIGATQALSAGETMSETLRRKLRGWRKPPAAVAHPDARIAPPAAVPLRQGVALATRGLSVRYGTVAALSNVELEVPEGAVFGLIGPNGAGKSTLIDAVAGFLHSYTGSVELAGQAVDDQPAHVRARNGIRRTWQTTRIAPELTVGAYAAPRRRRDVGQRGRGDPELDRVPASRHPGGERRCRHAAAARRRRRGGGAAPDRAAGRAGGRAVLRGDAQARPPHRRDPKTVRLRGAAGRARHGPGAGGLFGDHGAGFWPRHRRRTAGAGAGGSAGEESLSGH